MSINESFGDFGDKCVGILINKNWWLFSYNFSLEWCKLQELGYLSYQDASRPEYQKECHLQTLQGHQLLGQGFGGLTYVSSADLELDLLIEFF